MRFDGRPVDVHGTKVGAELGNTPEAASPTVLLAAAIFNEYSLNTELWSLKVSQLTQCGLTDNASPLLQWARPATRTVE